MLTRNVTPFAFGTKVGSRRPPTPEMTVVVKGTFALAPGGVVTPLDEQLPLTGETFAEDDEERHRACLEPGDFADFKLSAEVLLRGHCHAPGGRPVIECPVRVSVGAWSKTILVVGRRVWSGDLVGERLSDPVPFKRMPLGWKQAFGGPGYARNPVGMGFGTREAPCLERPGEPIRSRRDCPEPVSFAPVSSTWAARAERRGTQYGASYQRTRAPYYAEDFDYRHFSSAPPDQWLPSFLRGDEEVTLVNLVPDAPTLTTRLPGVRLRVFVKDDEARFREVAMSLDTLYLEPDLGRLVLLWRGVDPVREDDLEDVATVLVASERLAETPLSPEHYRAELEAFESDPIGLATTFPPELLELAERDERKKRGEPEPEDPALAGLDPFSARMRKELGSFGAEQQAAMSADIEALLQAGPKSEAMRAELSKALGVEGGDLRAAMEKAMPPEDEAPPVPSTHKPGGMPSAGLRKRMRALLEDLDEAERELEARERALAEQMKALPPGASGVAVPVVSAEAREQLAAGRKIPGDPRWAELDPGYTYPLPLSTDAPGPGVDLTDRDLTGMDLRGRDLRGAILDGAVLTKADLTGADLTGANLRHAVLFKTILNDAKLVSADLTRANLGRARLVGADLREATLTEAFFEGAALCDANLARASGEYAVFVEADLSRARAPGANLPRASFVEADLAGADLAGAVLYESLFEGTRAADVDLSGADVSRSSFDKADLSGARLRGALGERANFLGATLDRADLELSRMRSAHFTKASLVGASLYGADLRQTRFYRAQLERADLSRANLFQADLCKARLEGTTMRGATLYEAKLLGAKGKGLDLSGAVVTRVVRDAT